MAGVAGALYVPQVGIINPSEFAPGNSIEAVIWVAVGGRRHADWSRARRGRGQLCQDILYFGRACAVLAIHAGRHVHPGNAGCCPRAIVCTFNSWWEPLKTRRLAANAESAAAEDGVSEPHMAEW